MDKPKWLLINVKDMFFHIVPEDELDNHDPTTDCTCSPVVNVIDGGYLQVVHNSFDGREYIERLVADIRLN